MPIPWSGCTIFYGASVPKGYGVIWYQGRQTYTHRVAYELANGPIPDGMQVCHKCDVSSCINPTHLFLGTQRDNIHDMMRKGRGKYPGALGNLNSTRKHPEIVQGENNGQAKLSEHLVVEIRRAYSNGKTQVVLAKEYGVGQAQISKIVRRESWPMV